MVNCMCNGYGASYLGLVEGVGVEDVYGREVYGLPSRDT